MLPQTTDIGVPRLRLFTDFCAGLGEAGRKWAGLSENKQLNRIYVEIISQPSTDECFMPMQKTSTKSNANQQQLPSR